MKQNTWWLSILFLFCGLISFTGQATQAAPSNQLFGQEVPTGIRRIGVSESGLVRIDGIDDKPNVTVAVIDSGVDSTHPDLRLRPGIDCYTHPESPAESTQGSSPDDNHGTMAAGIIGAIDNNIGVVGVAPGVFIRPIRVGTHNGAANISEAALLCAFNWVRDHADEIDVVNLSIAQQPSAAPIDTTCNAEDHRELRQAICAVTERGIPVVVSAGNDHVDVSGIFPAAMDAVIAVSAMNDYDGKPGGEASALSLGRLVTCPFDFGGDFDPVKAWQRKTNYDDSFADYSNYGSLIALAGPGSCIRSTDRGGGYANMTGTSFAGPHVAGAAALYKARYPCATADETRNVLKFIAEQDWRRKDGVNDPDTVNEGLVNVRRISSAPPPDMSVFLLERPEIPVLAPGKQTTITLKLQNASERAWGERRPVRLERVPNTARLGPDTYSFPERIAPYGEVHLQLQIIAPTVAGVYEPTWQMTCGGQPFGSAIKVPIVVVPPDSSSEVQATIQAMIADVRDKLAASFDAAWQDLKQRITAYLLEQASHELYRVTGGFCGTPPAIVLVSGGVAWWQRRKRRNKAGKVRDN